MPESRAHDGVVLHLMISPRFAAQWRVVNLLLVAYVVGFTMLVSVQERSPGEGVFLVALVTAFASGIYLWGTFGSPRDIVLTERVLHCRWQVFGRILHVETPLSDVRSISFGRAMPVYTRSIFVHRTCGRALRIHLARVKGGRPFLPYEVVENASATVFETVDGEPKHAEAFAALLGAMSGAPIDTAISPRGLPLGAITAGERGDRGANPRGVAGDEPAELR